jgi:hypothetical protein
MVVFVAGILLLGYFMNVVVLCNKIPKLVNPQERMVNTISIIITMLAAVGVIYLAAN